MNLVVLVDSDNAFVGVLGKIEAHRRGALHRALSVSVSDSDRLRSMLPGPGLWLLGCTPEAILARSILRFQFGGILYRYNTWSTKKRATPKMTSSCARPLTVR
jgi:hypothetical protein